MNRKEIAKLGREAQKPKLVFRCKDYKIETIPLNYRITFRSSLKVKKTNYSIDKDIYSDITKGLEVAKELAQSKREDYFK